VISSPVAFDPRFFSPQAVAQPDADAREELPGRRDRLKPIADRFTIGSVGERMVLVIPPGDDLT
jgi:hypothetical protein